MFHVQQRDGASVIEIDDDLDVVTARALESALVLAETSPAQRIVISFENCAYCDSSGLSVLAKAKTRLGAQLVIVVPPKNQIHRILEITGLSKLLNPYVDLQGALGVPLSEAS